jgi:hypothetical protein
MNGLLPVSTRGWEPPTARPPTRRCLSRPGFMMLNYGPRTPLATLAPHASYGAIVGGFISLAS